MPKSERISTKTPEFIKLYEGLKDQLLNVQKSLCTLTGRKLVPGVNINLDHVVALANGGENVLTNFEFVCDEANTMKGTLSKPQMFDLGLDVVIWNSCAIKKLRPEKVDILCEKFGCQCNCRKKHE